MTHPAPSDPPLAQFTVTIHDGGIRLLDHADHSRHHFKNLLSALSYMEKVAQTRLRALKEGRLL